MTSTARPWVRSGQWGSGAQDTQRSTAIAMTTCLPRKVHIIVRISSRTQRGSPRSLPNSKDIASEVLERLEPVAACIERNLGVSIGECQGFSIERNAGARVLGSFQTIPTTHPRSLMRCARAEVSRGMAQKVLTWPCVRSRLMEAINAHTAFRRPR